MLPKFRAPSRIPLPTEVTKSESHNPGGNQTPVVSHLAGLDADRRCWRNRVAPRRLRHVLSAVAELYPLKIKQEESPTMKALQEITHGLRHQMREKQRYVRQLNQVIRALDPAVHWTQRPENRRKMLGVVRDMQRAKAA